MRKILVIITFLLLVLPLCGCVGSGETNTTTTVPTTAAPTTQPPTTSAPTTTLAPTTRPPTTAAPSYRINNYSAFGSYSSYDYMDEISVHGRITDSNGGTYANRDVYVSFNGTVMESSITTDSTGYFDVLISAPSYESDTPCEVRVYLETNSYFALGTLIIEANPQYPLRTISVGEQMVKLFGDATITLDKIDLCAGCTIVYLTVDNESDIDITLSVYNSYFIYSRTQYEHKHISGIDEIFKIPAGVYEENVIVFEPLPQNASGSATVRIATGFINDKTWEFEVTI
jgi:hypothetical protein